jgi:hypothetical protein
MGLRDFFKGKDKEPEEVKIEAPAVILQPAPLPPSVPKPLRMGEDPSTKEVNVHSLDTIGGKETVQDRINRVKSGRMTEDEKRNFLETALTAGNTVENRKPVFDSSSKRNPLKASPFPQDSILRNFARGKGKEATIVNSDDSQNKKRQYLDMVTNPERFRTMNTSATKTSATTNTGVERISGSSQGLKKTPIPGNWLFQKQTEPSTSTTNANTNLPSTNLGARLGAAAMADENRRKDAERVKQEQMEDRAAELAVRNQAEMARMEQERRQLSEQERQRQAHQQAEKERLQTLMQQQEDYWTKKLAKEREIKAQKESAQQAAATAAAAASKVPIKKTRAAPAVLITTPTEIPPTPLAETPEAGASSVIFNPDESSLLNDVCCC